MTFGLTLGVITYISLLITFFKLPKFIRKLLARFKLFTDLIASILVYLMLGTISQSITAVTAAIVCGLLVGISLEAYSFFGKLNVRPRPTSINV